MPTLLTYDYVTSPFPLQASPDTGDLLRANLTIVATNPGPAIVTLQGIEITLPPGKDGNDLTPDASTVLSVRAPPSWQRQTDNVADNVFLFQLMSSGQPVPATVAAGATLTFVIAGVQINRTPGTADVPLVEGSDGNPTHDFSITKFPNGWGEVIFTTDPLPPIAYDGSVSLEWQGPAAATYTLAYALDNKPYAVALPGNHGRWPAQNEPPLVLTQDIIFYLEVVDGEHRAQKPFPVTVLQPPPNITLFKAAWSSAGDRLIFTWDTQHATSCTLTGQHGPVAVSSRDGSFFITPSVDQPLLPSYTLSASGNGVAPPSTIRMKLQRAADTPIPDGLTGGMLAGAAHGGTVIVGFADQQSSPPSIAIYLLDPAGNAFSNKKVIADTANAFSIAPSALAVAPRGNRVYIGGQIYRPSGPLYFLAGYDAKDSTPPVLNLNGDANDSYVSIAASNVNVLVGVQHIDGMTASARLLVFDRYNLATAAKAIPLKRVVATVCVSPDGTRAFVVDADRANPAVFLIDVNAGQITKTIAFNDPSMWAAAFSADTERLVVIGARTATVIDTSAFAVLGQATLSPSGLAVALSPDGATACVSSCLTVDPGTSNSVCVIDLADLAAAPDAFRFDNVANTPGPPVFTADNVQALVTAAGKSTILTLRRVPTGGTP